MMRVTTPLIRPLATLGATFSPLTRGEASRSVIPRPAQRGEGAAKRRVRGACN